MKVKSKLKNLVNSVLGVLDVEVVKKSDIPFFFEPRYQEQIYFWRECKTRFSHWYDGKLEPLFGENAPREDQKISNQGREYNSLLTWLNLHQSPKYLEDLDLKPDAFLGMKLLDIGSGPFPSAEAYKDCEVFCLDPLLPLYLTTGYPIHIYEPRIKFVFGFSEKMPFESNYFDAIISVNALDHVDDFEATVKEIQRVSKPNVKMRFHLHYHRKTKTEPIELNDLRVSNAFNWDPKFKKLRESHTKKGKTIEKEDEIYTLWSNF